MTSGLFEEALKAQREKFEQIKKEDEAIEETQRKSGRTTRIVDKLIQEIFSKGKVTLIDHSEGGNNPRANAYVSERFEARFRREHPNIKIIFGSDKGVHTARIVNN